MSSKKMPIAKKYFCFHGLDRKKVGLKRVRIAKKNHSSLLAWKINGLGLTVRVKRLVLLGGYVNRLKTLTLIL
jgi:hypothetical protein